MTRKDYILIAKAVRPVLVALIETDHKAALVPANRIAENLAYELAQANPHFDADHFLAVVRGEKELNSKPSKDRTPEQGFPRCYDVKGGRS